MAHMEMIAALVYKLVDGASAKDYEEAGWVSQYAQHRNGLFWTDANGVPWCAAYIACLGDPIADLTDDPLAKDTLRFLWQREVVNFQRFGEMLNTVQEHMRKKNMWCGCERE